MHCQGSGRFCSKDCERVYLRSKYNNVPLNRYEMLRKQKMDEKLEEAADSMIRPYGYSRTIVRAMGEASRRNLKVCSMDVETAEVVNENGSWQVVPIWVVIIDGDGDVVYNEFIRHPGCKIYDSRFRTPIHGLVPKDIERGVVFSCARATIVNLLDQFDRIIVSGQYQDFETLEISPEDHFQNYLPKIVDISSYYDCHKVHERLGLKRCAFVMFNVILQSGHHSALTDAMYTLYLYLIDFHRIERIVPSLDYVIHLGNDYNGYQYPKNQLMASLLRNTLNQVGDWPNSFKYSPYDNERKRYRKMCSRVYNSNDYINGVPDDELPHPYRMTNNRLNEIDSAKFRSI